MFTLIIKVHALQKESNHKSSLSMSALMRSDDYSVKVMQNFQPFCKSHPQCLRVDLTQLCQCFEALSESVPADKPDRQTRSQASCIPFSGSGSTFPTC